MLTSDLVKQIQAKTGLTAKDAKAALKAMVDAVTEALASGEKVLITGFGTFLVRNRKARTGVNPQNPSQKIQLPASVVAAFKPGNTLKSAVRGGKRKAKK